MRNAIRSRLFLFVAAAAATAGAACSSSSGTAGSPPATLVTVNPSSFGGNVTCAALPGAWRRYVATLIDVTDPDHPFRLASSGPVPCEQSVSFAFVVPGHYYIAEIQGYDRDDIVPAGSQPGGALTGTPDMIDPATGLAVASRWDTTCGAIPDLSSIGDAGVDANDSDADITAAFVESTTVCWLSTNVVVQHCAPLEPNDNLPPGDMTITLDLAKVRGSLACGADPGQIARLRVVPDDTTLPARPAACDESLTFDGLTPNLDYRFRVDAFEESSSGASWATTCRASTREGIAVPAVCDPLSDRGSVVVDFESLLAASGHACSATDIVGYSAVLLGSAQQNGELACTASATFNGLPAATYQVVVDAFDAGHTRAFTAFCDAAVKPGRSTTATCSLAVAQ